MGVGREMHSRCLDYLDEYAGRVDLIIRLPGVEEFDRLYDNSEVVEFGGSKICVASLEDLLLMKSASDRPKDATHCEEIKALLRLKAES
jgi:hypothetical protein